MGITSIETSLLTENNGKDNRASSVTSLNLLSLMKLTQAKSAVQLSRPATGNIFVWNKVTNTYQCWCYPMLAPTGAALVCAGQISALPKTASFPTETANQVYRPTRVFAAPQARVFLETNDNRFIIRAMRMEQLQCSCGFMVVSTMDKHRCYQLTLITPFHLWDIGQH